MGVRRNFKQLGKPSWSDDLCGQQNTCVILVGLVCYG